MNGLHHIIVGWDHGLDRVLIGLRQGWRQPLVAELGRGSRLAVMCQGFAKVGCDGE